VADLQRIPAFFAPGKEMVAAASDNNFADIGPAPGF
jgi:hypothetical protein